MTDKAEDKYAREKNAFFLSIEPNTFILNETKKKKLF